MFDACDMAIPTGPKTVFEEMACVEREARQEGRKREAPEQSFEGLGEGQITPW